MFATFSVLYQIKAVLGQSQQSGSQILTLKIDWRARRFLTIFKKFSQNSQIRSLSLTLWKKCIKAKTKDFCVGMGRKLVKLKTWIKCCTTGAKAIRYLRTSRSLISIILQAIIAKIKASLGIESITQWFTGTIKFSSMEVRFMTEKFQSP